MTTALSALSSFVIIVWNVCGVVIYTCKFMNGTPPAVLRFLFHELRPFYLPAVAAWFAVDLLHGSATWQSGFLFGMYVWNWWWFKDVDDDDRWKRRRKRLAEKVSAVGGRLVVSPAGVR